MEYKTQTLICVKQTKNNEHGVAMDKVKKSI